MDPTAPVALLERVRRVLAPQYTIERQLAAGGMGVVYLGTDVTLDRRVAIKVLRPEYTSPAGRQRFTREARLLAKLQHPNIVTVHQANEVGGVRYFVMDYIDGPTLADRLADGPLDQESVQALGGDLLSALEAAHSAGIIHRDVKPANIFLLGNRALLGDFGIASVGDTTDSADVTLTHTGDRIGTPAYMSPEQIAGSEASARTDIYGVGLVLFQACTGRRWAPATEPDKADWTGVPPGLRSALRKALAVLPDGRWQDAATFRRALWRPSTPWLVPVALAAAAALVLLSIFRSAASHDTHPAGRTDFAVVPFSGPTGDDTIGQRLARYVGNELEWFPGWRLTSVPTSFAWWASAAPNRRALEAPAALGARFYAEGELLPGERTVRVAVRDSSGAPYYRLTVTGEPSDLLGWGSAIADSLVRILFPQRIDEFRDVSTRGSRNVQAYTELFAGQEAFRIDDWAGAEAHYRRALELDPTFAEAAWKLALVNRWRDRSFDAEWRRLYQLHRSQLPELQQLIIAAQLGPDLPARFAELEAAVRQYPRSTEGVLVEADELFHRGPLAGVPLDTAVQLFVDVSRREPYMTAYEHIAWAEIRHGREAEARRALQELNRSRDAASVAEARQRARLLALVYDFRFRPWRGRLKVRWLGWRADSTTLAALAQYARWGLLFDVPELQRQLGELLISSGTTLGMRAQGYEARGIALMTEGRQRAALPDFDSAASLFGTPEVAIERAEWRLLPGVLGLPPADSASTGLARSTLAAIDGPQGARAAWALAVDATTSGDSVSLARWRAKLDAVGRGDATTRRLSRLVEALARARAGDVADALALTDSLLLYDSAALAQAPFARALLYLRRGEWLAATGASDQAASTWLWHESSDFEGWLNHGVQAGEVDGVAGVLARLRLAELAAKRGNATVSCAEATRVKQLWADADPSYRDLVGRAASLAAACHH